MNTQLNEKNAQAVLDWILNSGIKPQAERLAEIHLTGNVAVLILNPSDESKKGARALGWDGSTPVFPMSSGARKRIVSASDDYVFTRWLSRKAGPLRIFALVESGTFLINFDAETGFSLEDGSGGKA